MNVSNAAGFLSPSVTEASINEHKLIRSSLISQKEVRLTQRAPDPSTGSGQAGGTRRAKVGVHWAQAGSVKAVLSHPAPPG